MRQRRGRLAECGLNYVIVSIDSHIPEVHDRYRGVAGIFDKAVRGLTRLRKTDSRIYAAAAELRAVRGGHQPGAVTPGKGPEVV